MVGRHCAVRVQLYHVLWHYKHKLRAKLLKALKTARAELKACSRSLVLCVPKCASKSVWGFQLLGTAVVTLVKKSPSNTFRNCNTCSAI